jgi:hypothetical protein
MEEKLVVVWAMKIKWRSSKASECVEWIVDWTSGCLL